MIESQYGYGVWLAVIFNVMLILFFALGFLAPRGKWEWRSLGVFTGFFVALFSHINGHLLLVFFGGGVFTNFLIHTISNGLLVAGIIIMGMGWKRIHAAGGDLVTSGIYSRVRHPQYNGLFLISAGLMIQWPTLVTLLLWPVMFVVYYRLAMKEERKMIELFGERYLDYKKSVPAFFPRFWVKEKVEELGKLYT
jgi:protein-S-isoprenylcysteine O-methyltransferase Ste14